MTRSHAATIVLATENAGKLRELREAFAGRPFDAVPARAAGVAAFPPEEGETYGANALGKALHVASSTGLPALGDDSGLEVDALQGAPGVRSARYGGAGLRDEERVALLLRELRGVPEAERSARFVTVLALATPAGETRLFEGRCEGRILDAPTGGDGFGYEPVFFHPGLGKSFAQASLAEKRSVSHRGDAIRAFLRWLDEGGAERLAPGPPTDAPSGTAD